MSVLAGIGNTPLMVQALLAVCTIIVPAAGAQSPASSDSAALAALEQRIEDAVVRRDTLELGRLYDPAFRFTHSTGHVDSRAAWLASVAGDRYALRRVDSLLVAVHGDVALVTGRLHVRRMPDAPGWQEYTIRYARLYVRRAGAWRLLAHHSTGHTIAPPARGAQARAPAG